MLNASAMFLRRVVSKQDSCSAKIKLSYMMVMIVLKSWTLHFWVKPSDALNAEVEL